MTFEHGHLHENRNYTSIVLKVTQELPGSFFYNPVWFITPEEVTGKSVRVFVLSWHTVGEDKNV